MSMLFSWPVSVKGAADTAAEEAAAAFDSPSGTCLDWPNEAPQNMRRVPCKEPHTFEVTSNIEIASDYPSSAPPPNDAGWQQIVTERCSEVGARYVGGTLDPYGKYTVGALKPTADQWREGDRKLRCGLQRVTPSGKRLLATTGTAAKQDQSNVHDPGTCFALVNKQEVGDPVDCAKEHSYEVVGHVDLSQVFPGEYPSEDQQREKTVDLCPPVAAQYTGSKDLNALSLSLYSDTLKQESWAAGSRKVNCKVGALEPDGSLRPVRGSVKAQPAPKTSTPPSSK
ncbi:septum formation family protein [Actinophytocola oryzae]|nr:septum formation family protein [Actinophytocola oryzae]